MLLGTMILTPPFGQFTPGGSGTTMIPPFGGGFGGGFGGCGLHFIGV